LGEDGSEESKRSLQMVESGKGIGMEIEQENVLRIPNWLSEAVMYGKYWFDSGLVPRDGQRG
jgi:hypothetical protein